MHRVGFYTSTSLPPQSAVNGKNDLCGIIRSGHCILKSCLGESPLRHLTRISFRDIPLWIARHVRGILIDTLAHALDVNVQSSYDGNSILHILATRRETALMRKVMSIPGVDTSLLNHNQETAEFIARKGEEEKME